MATKTNKSIQLPISRVKTIMKSSPEVEHISNGSIHLVAKATELFIRYMTQESFMFTDNDDFLDYKDIAEMVERDHRLEFLKELIPPKITIREYKQLMNQTKAASNSASSEDSS